MTIELNDQAAIGEAHRARLRALIVPRLYVGARIPTAKFIARILGIDESRAGKHMRRVLLEDGIITETRRVDTGCRVYVVDLGYNGNGRADGLPGRLKERSDGEDRQVPAVDSSAPDARRPGDDTPTVGQGASRGAASAGSRPSERRAAA